MLSKSVNINKIRLENKGLEVIREHNVTGESKRAFSVSEGNVHFLVESIYWSHLRDKRVCFVNNGYVNVLCER